MSSLWRVVWCGSLLVSAFRLPGATPGSVRQFSCVIHAAEATSSRGTTNAVVPSDGDGPTMSSFRAPWERRGHSCGDPVLSRQDPEFALAPLREHIDSKFRPGPASYCRSLGQRGCRMGAPFAAAALHSCARHRSPSVRGGGAIRGFRPNREPVGSWRQPWPS